MTLEIDASGQIKEDSIGEFAMSEGQDGSEFYAPASIVQLLAPVIEHVHGRILDIAFGLDGMFLHMIRCAAEDHQNAAAELAICYVEKTDETGSFARLNLATHELESNLRHGRNVNSYYDEPIATPGQFDIVLSDPLFIDPGTVMRTDFSASRSTRFILGDDHGRSL